MKKYLLPLILILLLTFTLVGNCDWLSGYDQRIKLTVQDADIDTANLTWFPVTVFLTGSQAEEVFAEFDADSDYLKVAFTKVDGETELYAECELFDDSESLGIYHVSRDGWVIAYDADTDFYMYYDNDHADNTTYIGAIDTVAGGNVWDGNFKAVFHMVDATTSTVKDSTSNNNDGTKKGAGEPASATGKVGLGQDFDGDDYMSVADSADFDFAAGFTLEFVADPDSIDISNRLIARYDGTSKDGYFLCQNTAGDGRWLAYVYVNPTYKDIYSNAAPSGSFQHIVVSRDGDGLIVMYVDGAIQTDTDTLSGAIDSNGVLALGINEALIALGFTGIGDEVRVSNANRTASWEKATYNSLWDTLLTYGSEESAPAGGITWNTVEISKWNNVEISKWNGI